ncbi:MAG: hypothetical protein R6U63_11080 [Longimicrobiales bacterium]
MTAPVPIRTAALAALLALLPVSARAQGGPRIVPVPRADTVYLYLLSPPSQHTGFVVERMTAGDTLERLTPAPVRPVRRRGDVIAMLGPELERVMAVARVSEPARLIPRLRSDPLAGLVVTLLFPTAADALGRRYRDTAVVAGAEYEYRVTLLDATGAPLGDPLTARVRVQDREPAAPPALTAEPGDGEVHLEWEYPAYRDGDHVVAFHIYRRRAGDPAGELRRLNGAPILRNDAAPRVYRDTAAATGVRYGYQVRAVDMLRRESGPSAVALAAAEDRTPPAPPRDVVAVPGDGQVYLIWRRATEPDAAGYHVERADRVDGSYRRLNPAPIPAADPEWLDTDVSPQVQYFYRVRTVDAAGNESAPHGLEQALPEDHTPPAPAGAVTAEVEDRRLTIRWEASPSDDVLGYYIYRGDGPDRLVRLVRQPVADTVFVDTGFEGRGLAPGGSYTVQVAAVDRAYNESEPVRIAVDVPDDEAPTPPTGVSARNVRGRYVELRWSPSVALDVRAYEIARVPAAEDAAAGERAGEGVPLGAVPADRDGYLRDTTAAVGSYEYRLVAVDSAGNRSAPAVARVELGDRHRPATPRFPTARVVGAGVRVGWQRVASRDLLGYRVYRAGLPTGQFQRLNDEPVEDVTFTDPNGEPHYYYVVRAVDRSGNESAASAPVRAGPPSPPGEESRP